MPEDAIYEYMYLESNYNVVDLVDRINTCSTQGWRLHTMFFNNSIMCTVAVLERPKDYHPDDLASKTYQSTFTESFKTSHICRKAAYHAGLHYCASPGCAYVWDD